MHNKGKASSVGFHEEYGNQNTMPKWGYDLVTHTRDKNKNTLKVSIKIYIKKTPKIYKGHTYTKHENQKTNPKPAYDLDIRTKNGKPGNKTPKSGYDLDIRTENLNQNKALTSRIYGD